MVFKLFKKKADRAVVAWRCRWHGDGLQLTQSADGEPVSDAVLDEIVGQLQDDGYVLETGDGYLISWDALYELIKSPHYPDLIESLDIPPQTSSRIMLHSRQALSDPDFSLAVTGWYDPVGNAYLPELTGALMTHNGRNELMQPAQWRLFNEVIGFARRLPGCHDDRYHRQAWSRIRRLALDAGAKLDDFLTRSIVITPETLEIGLRKSVVVAEDHVIEIVPGFAGAPPDWLDYFDRSSSVRDRYDISTPDGLVQVLVSPPVRNVLAEIKRLPGRRVAGARAQAFILNPYATLGDDANEVIVESQFEQAREAAGIAYERFLPVVERDTSYYPVRVGLRIETAVASGPTSAEIYWLGDPELDRFIGKAEAALAREYQLIAWEGFDLEVDGETRDYLTELKGIRDERRQLPSLVSHAQVHDLRVYSTRVESIGIEQTVYSPYIASRKDGIIWFPENVLPIIVYQADEHTEPVAIPTSNEALDELVRATQQAQREGDAYVTVSWLPRPMPIAEALHIGNTFAATFEDVQKGQFDPGKAPSGLNQGAGIRKSLILRANIESLDYEERRREALKAVPEHPTLPTSLRPDVTLMAHQLAGVAWMQHLCSAQAEHQVRGAVLADDMGLGKTLQLLVLMASLLEQKPQMDPILVVAPVSLLENWKDEAQKFFMPDTLPILTAYGDALSALRVPRQQIEERLRLEDGLVKFLRPGWLGNAKLVLTTYETLRDLEFSFAAQRWSVMVCDEAQRIKNPAAMVTRAAKKQNVGFKIACTGTPVENTLADLWSLFDFVQPGLLGALNEFGQRYGKPIEAKDDEERARVEELRRNIAPQILRRTKAEVATNLPRKIVVDTCRNLPLSAAQRQLYAKAIDDYKKRNDPATPSPFKNHLGLLHYLRLICTDPRRHGLSVFKPEPLAQYRAKAPKLDWLLNLLDVIKAQGEKVIIFCEFRHIQRLLQHYIAQACHTRPDIINGDTSVTAHHVDNRQKRICSFQAQPGFAVLILSPVAVGFGVNIQAANHVVHYTRTWNPAKEDQATDRAYRIGQKKDVYVYYPVVSASDFSTFDVRLDQLLNQRRELANDMLNGSGDLGPNDFQVADLVPDADLVGIDDVITLDTVMRMDWQYVECLVTVLWTKQGFRCYRTPDRNDNGVDVVALGDGVGALIQVKTSSDDHARLNWDAVKEVVAGTAYYQRRHPGLEFDKVCLTNQFFNAQALENAALNSVTVVDQIGLSEMLKRYQVTMMEIERVMFAKWEGDDKKNVDFLIFDRKRGDILI